MGYNSFYGVSSKRSEVEAERNFEGFDKYEAVQIQTRAEIKAPIFAKAIAKEIKKLLKK